MSANLEQRFVEAGGYRTSYVEAGSGDVVVCIHSANPGSTGALEYRHNLGPLSERFRVIAPDLIGAGRTEPPKASLPSAYRAECCCSAAADSPAGNRSHARLTPTASGLAQLMLQPTAATER